MVTRAQATGIPVKVKLGGEEYQASVWTQREFAEWEEWVRATYRKRALEGVETMSDELRRDFTLQVFERASKLTFVSTESTSLMASPAGFIRAWWMSIKINHPKITEDDVGKLLLHPKTDYDKLAELAILGSPGKRKKKGGTKAQQRQKQRKKRR